MEKNNELNRHVQSSLTGDQTSEVTSIPLEDKALNGRGRLTVHSLASSNPETEIAPLLSSVLFGNTKAKQIVAAAKDVLAKFGGEVPESISSLKEITGIGPKLAEILNIVNKRNSFSRDT